MIAQTLDQVMEQWADAKRPTIKPDLHRGQWRKWHVRLIEVWPSVDDAGNYYNSSVLDEKVEWTYQTLKTWNTAHRTAWDTWRFDSKRDAEKFITLYTLLWAE